MNEWEVYLEFIKNDIKKKEQEHKKYKDKIRELEIKLNNMYNNHKTITESLREEIAELRKENHNLILRIERFGN